MAGGQFIQVEGCVVMALSRDELVALASGLTEALEALESWEFATRVGVSVDDARRLQSELHDVLGRLNWAE